jgi:hypothetical protein
MSLSSNSYQSSSINISYSQNTTSSSSQNSVFNRPLVPPTVIPGQISLSMSDSLDLKLKLKLKSPNRSNIKQNGKSIYKRKFCFKPSDYDPDYNTTPSVYYPMIESALSNNREEITYAVQLMGEVDNLLHNQNVSNNTICNRINQLGMSNVDVMLYCLPSDIYQSLDDSDIADLYSTYNGITYTNEDYIYYSNSPSVMLTNGGYKYFYKSDDTELSWSEDKTLVKLISWDIEGANNEQTNSYVFCYDSVNKVSKILYRYNYQWPIFDWNSGQLTSQIVRPYIYDINLMADPSSSGCYQMQFNIDTEDNYSYVNYNLSCYSASSGGFINSVEMSRDAYYTTNTVFSIGNLYYQELFDPYGYIVYNGNSYYNTPTSWFSSYNQFPEYPYYVFDTYSPESDIMYTNSLPYFNNCYGLDNVYKSSGDIITNVVLNNCVTLGEQLIILTNIIDTNQINLLYSMSNDQIALNYVANSFQGCAFVYNTNTLRIHLWFPLVLPVTYYFYELYGPTISNLVGTLVLN